MFRLLVAGGRNFYDYRFIDKVLTEWMGKQDINSDEITLVHGDGNGTDRIAAQWAIYNEVNPEAHAADWSKLGRSAGPIRNVEMVNSGIDYAILFPGDRGTMDMKQRLINLGIKFQEVLDDIKY